MTKRAVRAHDGWVVCLGELLIDFVSMHHGSRLADATSFVRAAGGAPANVAVALARLGCPAAFIGKTGADEFGHFLRETLRGNGVDVSGIVSRAGAPTALAFVSLSKEGERDFLFYRNPCADALLRPTEVRKRSFNRGRIFHFGSISLIQEPSRSATLHAIEMAREKGLLISYDPNLRPPLWPSLATARRWILMGLRQADIVKMSEEEVRFLGGNGPIAHAVEQLRFPHQLFVVSLGAQGCYYRSPRHSGAVPAFRMRAVDTTGAGDAFVAGMLCGILAATHAKRKLDDLAPAELNSILRFANACGGLATQVRGAIPALPTRRDVERLLRTSGQSRY